MPVRRGSINAVLGDFGAMAPSACGRCGGPSPSGAVACEWCGAALFPVSPPLPVPQGYRPLPVPAVPPRDGSSSEVFYLVSIPLLVVGVLVLVAAALVSAGVNSFDRSCSQNPACQGNQPPDPSGAIAAGGVALIGVGVVMVGLGASRGSARSGDGSSGRLGGGTA